MSAAPAPSRVRLTLEIARFEARQRLRRVSTWVYFALFFAIAVLCVLAAGGALPGARVDFGGGAKVFVNSPYSIHSLEALIALFGTVVVASIGGQATFQDVDHRATALFFTAPIGERAYLAGRFLGAFAVSAWIYAAIGLGTAFALQLPALDPSRLGPPPGLLAYVQPYLTCLLPNLLVTLAVFFTVAALTRRMVPVHAGSVVLLLGYLIALNLSDDVENKALVSVLDPFAFLATARLTEYWTVVERNALRVPLSGVLLANRAVWLSVGASLLALTFARFSFTERRAPRTAPPAEPVDHAQLASLALPQVTLDRSTRAALATLARLAFLQWRETVKSTVFRVLVLAGLLFMATTAQSLGRMFGTETWPVTYQVLEVLGGSFQIFIVAVVTLYAGELVWRERDARLAPIMDALPTPRVVVLAAKWLALLGVEIVLLAVVLVAGVVVQALKGYHHHEIGLYLRWLFAMRLVDLAFLSTVALFVHSVVDHKYAGHAAMVAFYALSLLLPQLGLEHRLYLVGSQPPWMYSDMNGFGHFVVPIAALKLYWASLAVVLAVVTHLFWARGEAGTLRRRLRRARARLSAGSGAVLAIGLTAFVATGAWLFWSMNVVRPYRSTFAEEELAARYERAYKAEHEGAPSPRVASVELEVDLFPEERRVAVRGALALENRGAAPVTRLFVNIPEQASVEQLTFDRDERLVAEERDLGVRIYELGRPLAPGERAVAKLAASHVGRGIASDASDRHVVFNGTFVNGRMVVPTFGYDPARELTEDDRRRKHGLAPRARTRDLDDVTGLAHNYVSRDGDWIDFAATVSTSPDQIAIAPGDRTREWTEAGRRFFRYESRAPILNFYAFLSARYAVRRDAWNGVEIAVYHHEPHSYDVDRMIRGVKATLDYFAAEIGPYPHQQVRIVEFPRFERFAQAFPGTIPFSEAIGFIARVDDAKADEVDYPFYVTAHEVAHQWWAHQVIGGDVQGATMLSESFAQHSAFMVMKRAYGERAMRKFLRYELDSYLRGRGTETKKELPLVRVENQQYIHYAKGALVLYALQDAIGEATVNRALRVFLERERQKGPPYPNARQFVDVLRREAPPSAEPLIHDLFEAITLYDLRAASAVATKLEGGRYEVTVKASAKKLYAGELGAETEAPLDEEIAFGALDENGNALHVEKRRVGSGDVEVTFVVAGKPAKAGIDPLNGRIDRNPDDNVKPVELR